MKYGRPILDCGIVYGLTTLETAAKYALLSFDATMRSYVTVVPTVELLVYRNDALDLNCYRRFKGDDPELQTIHACWKQSLRRIGEDLSDIQFEGLDDFGCKTPFIPSYVTQSKL